MADILSEILSHLPDNAEISLCCFEGANIILYTKNADFFLNNQGIIKDLVDQFKKRIELRPDPSLSMEIEKAEKTVKGILPAEANVTNIIFDPQRSMVIIEAEKPGLVIGKSGELLKEIKQKTMFIPLIRRTPSIRSKIIENIRQVLYENNDFRKKFLNDVGKRIYNGWIRGKKNEWIRLSFLGGARQVGRSCLFLQTPESRILLDCGINVAASEEDAYPFFDAPEFKINEIDAIVITHAHLDHMAMVPMLFKYGYNGPVYCTAPTRDIMALLCLDYISVGQKEVRKPLFTSSDIKEMVKHTICLDYEEVTDITPDVRITLYNAGHTLGSAMVHLHVGNGLHNFLYSLDWNTPVTVIDGENNTFFKPIGEVIDKNFNDFSDLVTKKGYVEELPNFVGLKTISFNPSTYKTEIRTITSFVRHPIQEDLYELKTSSGRKVTVTKSHSVFSVKDGEVKAIKVEDLKEGDFIIGPKKVPLANKEPEINLFEHNTYFRVKISDLDLLEKVLAQYTNQLYKLKESDKKQALDWIISHYKHASYQYEIVKKYKVHPRRVKRVFKQLGIKEHPCAKYVFPAKFKIDKEFARFLGYFISEGHTCKNSQSIRISNTNPKILEDCYKIIKNSLGITGDVRYKNDVVLFHSKQLKYLLSHLLKCGKDAYSKRVPPQILLSNQEVISNFLYGYFSGDGGIIKKESGRCIFATSKNPDLIQDVTFLLLGIGIAPTITYNQYTKMHNANIYNSSKIQEFLEKVGIENGQLTALIPSLVRRKNKGCLDLRIHLPAFSKKGQLMLSKTSWKGSQSCNRALLKNFAFSDIDKKLINSDFMFDKIKEIKPIKPTKKYVYDFKIEGYENFLGGSGFLFLHNTGDMNFENSNLLPAAATKFPRLETMAIESTYGGKADVLPSRKECENVLMDIITRTVKRGGKVLLPVLGVGRSQEVMIILERALREGLVEKVPIYLQGMVWDVTAIHTAYPDFYNKHVRKLIFHENNNPFLSDIFKQVGSQKEMDAVINDAGPCVILATSGMMAGGASVDYFKALAENPKNSLVLTCYQGQGSLGRRLQEGEKEISFPIGQGRSEVIKVKMDIHTIQGFTGHSVRTQLINFVHHLEPRPKRIIVNHGESSKCLEFASYLHKLGNIETNAPRNLDVLRLK